MTEQFEPSKDELKHYLSSLSKHQLVEVRKTVTEQFVKRFKKSRIPKYGSLNKGFTELELKRFFSVIDNPKFHLLFSFQAQMGLRVGEAIQINVKDIKFESRELMVKTEKSNTIDVMLTPVPLFKATLDYIRANSLSIEASQGYIFFKEQGKSLNPQLHVEVNYVRNMFKYYRQKSGLEEVYDQSDETLYQRKPRMLHRLTTGNFGRYHTIIVEMSREIRDKGMLWITTQNYTDIPDSIRNQFASQFMFKSTGQNDLTALKAIEPLLSWTVSSLPKHYFVDAQFQEVHTYIPAFYYNPHGETDTKATVDETTAESAAKSIREPDGRPTPTLHAGMLALYNKPDASMKELVDYLKAQKWITSDATIYGSKDRRGVFDSLVSLGYATKGNGNYKLNSKALEWIDPDRLLAKANNPGSDLHKQLFKKAVERVHAENMLVTIPDSPDAPDMIVYPMAEGKKKYLWEDDKRRAYEIQTTARKDSIMPNMERNRKLEMPTTWVTYDEKVLSEIKDLTENKDEYLLVHL